VAGGTTTQGRRPLMGHATATCAVALPGPAARVPAGEGRLRGWARDERSELQPLAGRQQCGIAVLVFDAQQRDAAIIVDRPGNPHPPPWQRVVAHLVGEAVGHHAHDNKNNRRREQEENNGGRRSASPSDDDPTLLQAALAVDGPAGTVFVPVWAAYPAFGFGDRDALPRARRVAHARPAGRSGGEG
jgi:hypothetical protein